MLKTCRCLWERGLHSNAQVYVFQHSICENMRKSLLLSHSSVAYSLQSLLFPATSKPLLTLSFPYIYIYKRCPRWKHVPICQTLVLCTSSKNNVAGMYHTQFILSRSGKDNLEAATSLSRATWHSYRNPEHLITCLDHSQSRDITRLRGPGMW